MKKAALVALAVAAAAGCGHGDGAAVRRALSESPKTYLHFRDRAWWGRDVSIRIERLRISGNVATARVAARPNPHFEVERVVLRRRGGRWSVVDAGYALVQGRSAARAPTRDERRAIIAAARTIFDGHDRCVRYDVSVSRLDGRYARVAYAFHKPYRDCRLGNGETLLRRGPRGWRRLGDASAGFPCTYAPPGVVRSLTGSCWVAGGA